MLQFISNFLYSVIRISTPIIFIATASTLSQQSGLLNMAGESMMLSSALTGVIASAVFQNVWLGILAGVLMSVLITLLLCWSAFVMKVDLYLMSISLNMALGGATVLVVWMLTGTKANTAGAINSLALGNVHIPIIKNIPIIGTIISGHNMFTYFAIFTTFITWLILYKTRLGLRMRAIGQNPEAASSVGISVPLTYTLAFVLVAIIGSFGGMYLSMGYQNFFARLMTANRGFLGLAAATIANAEPFMSLFTSLMFGLAYSVSNYLQTVVTDAYLLQSIPFILSFIIYVGMSAWRAKEQDRLLAANRRKLLDEQKLNEKKI